MSEFKFACPVCGQHLSAGAADAGKQIECPTCFQKMVVPEPPISGSNLIRRAASAEPSKRGTHLQLGVVPNVPPRRSLPWAAIGLAAACVLAGAIAYQFRDRVFNKNSSIESLAGEERRSIESSADSPPANTFPWSLEVTNAVFPDQPTLGRLRGRDFQPNKTILQGGVLTFRQGKSAPSDLVLSVMLHAARGEDLAGKLVQVRSEQARAPTILVRWKSGETRLLTERHRSGYALRLLFGQPSEGRMPGKIWLSLPDLDQSFLSGTFEAEIRVPPPPKKTPPQAPEPAETSRSPGK